MLQKIDIKNKIHKLYIFIKKKNKKKTNKTNIKQCFKAIQNKYKLKLLKR